MKISYSALKSYEQCPLQYKFSYIDRLPRKDSIHLYFGNQIHDALDFMLKDSRQVKPLDGILKYFSRGWEIGKFKEIKDEEYIKRGSYILTRFHAKFNPRSQTVLETEQYFSAPLEHHEITGLIDRLDRLPDGSLEIIDYKTGKIHSQQDITKNLQLTFYHHAIQTRFPEEKQIKLSLHFLEAGQKFSSSRDSDAVAALAHEINSVADEIQIGSYQPKPNRLCPWCDYTEICPAYRATSKDQFQAHRQDFNQNLTQTELF